MEYKDIVSTLATLVASFAGAWAAFLFERQNRKRESQESDLGAANRAIYVLFNMWNILEQYRKEVLEPQRGKPDAWLNLAANPTIPTGETTFLASELQFLLRSKHAHTYATLMLEEQRFAIAIDLIRERSSLVLDEAFARFSKANIPVGASVPSDNVVNILGVGLVQKLRVMTPAIFVNVDENLASLRNSYILLRSSVEEIYPRRKLLSVNFESASQ